MINFLKTIRKKTVSALHHKLQERGGWYFKWHESPFYKPVHQTIFFAFLIFLSSFFVNKLNMIQLTTDLSDPLSQSGTNITTATVPSSDATVGSSTDTSASIEATTVPLTDENASSSDTTTSPSEETVTPTPAPTPADTTASSADTTSPAPEETVTPTPAPSSTPAPTPTPVPALTPTPQPKVQENIVLDQTSPAVTKIISPIVFGNFKSGVIPIMVLFNKPIVVSGTPQLILSTGSPETTAVNYKFGHGNLLLFLYHIQPGNYSSDLDYSSSSSLILNGGQIQDSSGNQADLTLPDPGLPGSLSTYSNITINASH